MKTIILRFVSTSLLVTLVLALIPSPVSAQTVLGVSPNPVVNNIDNTITVTGTLFDNTAVITMDGTPLASGTTFVDAQTLRATVPTGTSV